jgi:5-formyltetrahydrofolate cyclo-ligase
MASKPDLRRSIKHQFQAQPSDQLNRAHRKLLNQILAWSHAHARSGDVLSLFGGLPDEPDLTLILPDLWQSGLRTAFFLVPARQSMMEAREITDRSQLTRSTLGFWQPQIDAHQPLALHPSQISAFLVPGLAFCPLTGSRLGRGGGFYDRYLRLANPSAPRIGICLEFQLQENVPAEPHDIPMTHLLTESQFLTVNVT